MNNLKSKNIATLGNQISNIDRDINIIKDNENLLKKIVFYDGSGKLEEVLICEKLDQPLIDFLIDFYDKKKQSVYDKIQDELNTLEKQIEKQVDEITNISIKQNLENLENKLLANN